MKPTLELRDELHQLVKAQLMGPMEGEEEMLDTRRGSVRRRYLVGRLAPKRRAREDAPAQFAIDAHTEIDSPEDGQVEQALPTENSILPSSIGLSFAVDGAATEIAVTVRWAYYAPDKIEDEDGKPKPVWRRHPVTKTHRYHLAAGELARKEAASAEKPDVYLRGRCRWRKAGYWSVTLFLINDQMEPKQGKDAAWVFQPELHVHHPNGDPIFIKRNPQGMLHNLSVEDRAMRMLYRNTVEFGVGHGVAVHATVNPDNALQASALTTQVMPTYEVERMDPPDLKGVVLNMKTLGATPQGKFGAALQPLVDAYREWIGVQMGRVNSADLQNFQDEANGNLAAALVAAERIEAGIALLDSDPQAAAAFQFTNRVMAEQRIHSKYAREVRQSGKSDLKGIEANPFNYRWRPFQLAFVLLNLRSFVEPTSPERNEIGDLLWFPTGGGKTEAYLGAAAFAMGLRRLQRDQFELGYQGVTVLMRYTLRLLTLQQFQRAATLIAACEVERRRDVATWGDEPFRIGLWVGMRSTPNSTEDAATAINRERSKGEDGKGFHFAGSVGGSGTPYQLTTCPWCGKPLDVKKNIEVDTFKSGTGRTLQFCSDRFGRCAFSKKKAFNEGIPIVVVDEEIYRRLPTLLIATVDKFAQMPWKGETQTLFGRVSGYCERHGYVSPDMDEQCLSHRAKKSRGRTLPKTTRQAVTGLRPPDLIIQDELHLINGPLGTLVGLYETAVDALSSWELGEMRIRPKIIASTATIRRASEQVYQVFTRRVNVFPPPGLDADDNFFSRKRASSDAAPGRLYVGICAPGKSRMETLIPVYTAYMAAAQQLYEKYGAAADPWMTVVGYFNALRELGSMRRAVEDSVQTRLRRYEEKKGRRFFNITNVEELTSRKSAEDIPKILDRLENRFDPSLQKEGKWPKGKFPLDVVLATNMISVGVDVDRLGLMITAGQPKATAEYIQATSRVGRQFPGIVATVYTWSRPRDLSHYERFEHYHSTFYQQVEALSVTPFADRALDRGLTGVLAALIRLQDGDLNRNDAAGELDLQHPSVIAAKELLRKRAETVTGLNSSADRVVNMSDHRLDRWDAAANNPNIDLQYKGAQKGRKIGLLKRPLEEAWNDFTTLNSLRDVEPTVGLILKDWPEEE